MNSVNRVPNCNHINNTLGTSKLHTFNTLRTNTPLRHKINTRLRHKINKLYIQNIYAHYTK